MSYRQNNSYGSYNSYQSEERRNQGGFSGEGTGRNKRRRFQNGKRFPDHDTDGSRNVNPNMSPTFKTPLKPSGSPGGRPNPFRSPAREYLDGMKGHCFVEPQHSGTPWAWDTFNQQCKAWQDKHKLAYYKSRCMALDFENKMLFQQIQTLIDENAFLAQERGVKPSMIVPNLFNIPDKQSEQASSAPKKQGKTRQNKTTSTSADTSDTGIVFELDEDMMASLETRMRHKLSLKRQEDIKKEKPIEIPKKEKDFEKKEGPKQPRGQKRQEELELFYGKNANLIQGLETSLQLNFNRNCNTHQPKMWMEAPLNPNVLYESETECAY